MLSEAEIAWIYALIDPRSGRVRYVGKAGDPAWRLQKHLSPSQLAYHNHKAAWLRQLLHTGHTPTLVLLERTMGEAWRDAERRWIAWFRLIGAALTNLSDGGDSNTGYRHSPETRARIGMAQRGRIITPEHRARIRATLLGRPPTPEARAKITALQRGRRLLPERCAAIGDAHRGKVYSPQTRDRISAAHLGIKQRGAYSSRFVGVAWNSRQARWVAYISVDRKQRHLGSHATEEDAARAYDAAAITAYGLAARVNFPMESDHAARE